MKSIYNKLTGDKSKNDKIQGEDPTYGTTGALSAFVGDMLKQAKISKTKTNNVGSINLMRKSKISEVTEADPDVSTDTRLILAAQMLHSPATQLTYVRKLGIDKMTDEQMKQERNKYGMSDNDNTDDVIDAPQIKAPAKKAPAKKKKK
jgi:hypothetical protein